MIKHQERDYHNRKLLNRLITIMLTVINKCKFINEFVHIIKMLNCLYKQRKSIYHQILIKHQNPFLRNIIDLIGIQFSLLTSSIDGKYCIIHQMSLHAEVFVRFNFAFALTFSIDIIINTKAKLIEVFFIGKVFSLNMTSKFSIA